MTCYYFWNIQLENRKPKQHNQEQSREQSRGPTVSEHVGLHAKALPLHARRSTGRKAQHQTLEHADTQSPGTGCCFHMQGCTPV